jgi:hypothetical protein
MKYIYVICEAASAPVKIGFSADPEKRVKQLQTGHANVLTLFHKEEVEDEQVRVLERMVHKAIRHLRHTGEWFNLTPEDAVLEIKLAIMKYGDAAYDKTSALLKI